MAILAEFGTKTFKAKTFAPITFCGGSGVSSGSASNPVAGKRVHQTYGYRNIISFTDALDDELDYFGDSVNHAMRVSVVAGTANISEVSTTWAGTGAKSSVGGTAVQMTATSIPTMKGVVVKADAANTGTVYVGKDATVTAGTVDATDGFPLAKGDSVSIPVSNANMVYLIGSASGQKVYFAAV